MRVLRFVPLAIVVGCLGSGSAAAQVDEALHDYTLASWSTRDGLPSNFVTAVAQDSAGYLWVGTTAGLARFDGLRFVAADPLVPVRVTALVAASDDAMWVGHGLGRGVSVIRRGRVQRYDARDGLAGNIVNALVENAEEIWAGGDAGLFRLTGDRWARVSVDEGLPDTAVLSLRASRSGGLIVGTTAGLYRLSPGTERLERIDPFNDYGRGLLDVAEDDHGRVWVPDNETGFRPLGRLWPPPRLAVQAKGNRVLLDHQGNLWVGTTAALLRVRPAGPSADPSITRTEIFGGRSLFEDRGGNLWIGTVEGLFRLSARRVSGVRDLGVVSGVDATRDGSIWVGTSDGLFRYPPRALSPERQSIPGRRVMGLHTDSNGTLWLRTDIGLARIIDGRPAEVVGVRGVEPSDIDALLPDQEGVLWMSTRTRGLLAWRNGRIEQAPELGTARVTVLLADRRGRLWLLAGGDRLFVLFPDGQMRSFGAPAGLGAAPYRAVYEDSRGIIWIGGSEGFGRLAGDRFVVIRQANVTLAVSAIIEDEDGDLWLGSSEGIAVVPRAELDAAMDDESYAVRLGIFDASDGLAGVSMLAAFGSRNVARGGDGRLWFLTGRGLSVVSPRDLKGRARPMTLQIQDITVDDGAAGASPVTLAHGVERLQIDYAAVQLSSPQKVRYRYLLEGFDAEWIDAGSRRVAVYQHLPARQYNFRVVASNIESPWTHSEAVWTFSVSPPVYQTPWFLVPTAVVALGATWGVWQLRLRSHRRQFALLLAERARLSRELHDTLLQSLVAMTLQCEAAAGRLEPASPVRRQIIALRRQMEEFIREAREAIWNLRLPAAQAAGLAEVLRDSCERTLGASTGDGPRLVFSIEGTPRRCAPEIERQLLRIGQESVLNARRHARAREVRVALAYAPDMILLRVSDDGRGFAVADAERVQNGHLGLITMSERAKEMGAELRLESVVGCGTRIEVAVPTTTWRASVAM